MILIAIVLQLLISGRLTYSSDNTVYYGLYVCLMWLCLRWHAERVAQTDCFDIYMIQVIIVR